MLNETTTDQGIVKYKQVKNLLCKRLVESGAQPGEKLWTEAELMQDFGVSVTTVRRALDELVREEIVERKTGKGTFLKSMQANQPRRMEIVAMLAHKSWAGLYDDPYYGEVIRSIEHKLAENHHRLVVITHNPKHDPGLVTEAIRMHNPAGIIVPYGRLDKQAMLSRLATIGVPVLLIGNPIPGFAGGQVYFNNRGGGAMAARYLIGRGLHNFGVIDAPTGSLAGEERVEGFVSTIESAPGCAIVGRAVPQDYSERDGQRILPHLMQICSTEPDAIFCAGDLLAYGAISRLAELELSVPRDIKVMGFGGFQHVSIFCPKLTTVRMDLAKLGEVAADWLKTVVNHDENDGPIHPFECELPVTVQEGESA